MSNKRIKVISFKLQEHELIELDKYAEKKGVSRSEVIREALYRLIRKGGDGAENDDEYLAIDFSSKKIESDIHIMSDITTKNNSGNKYSGESIRKHLISIDCCIDQDT
ncbi:MAG: ribbon-helix-helix protein, CopG family [Sulfolobales archaeon]